MNLEQDLKHALHDPNGAWTVKLGELKEEFQTKHREFKYKLAHMETLRKELAVVDAEVHRLESKLAYRRKRVRELSDQMSAAKKDKIDEGEYTLFYKQLHFRSEP